jgi:hypothetical protein
MHGEVEAAHDQAAPDELRGDYGEVEAAHDHEHGHRKRRVLRIWGRQR